MLDSAIELKMEKMISVILSDFFILKVVCYMGGNYALTGIVNSRRHWTSGTHIIFMYLLFLFSRWSHGDYYYFFN